MSKMKVNRIENTATTDGGIDIDSSGRLLVGATTEGEATADNLTIADSGHCGITLRSGTSSVGTIFFSDGTSGTAEYQGYVQYDHGGNYLKWATAATERLRLDSSGRLLVGTTTANAAPLTVNGTTESSGSKFRAVFGDGFIDADSGRVFGANPAEVQIHTASASRPAVLSLGGPQGTSESLGMINFFNSGNGDDHRSRALIVAVQEGSNSNQGAALRFYTAADGASSPTERMRLDGSGRLFLYGITGNAASGSTLKYNASDDEVRYDTSSRLLKTDITEIPYGIETVKNLKPSRYTPQEYDREGNLVVSTETAIGFIADEMVAEVPEVVMMYQKSTLTRNENDTEVVPAAINYDRLTAVLTKALQEAISKIETLETEVAALKAGA